MGSEFGKHFFLISKYLLFPSLPFSFYLAFSIELCMFVFRFRLFCRRVISHKMFDHVILMFILLSCIAIALERPGIDPASTVRHTY